MKTQERGERGCKPWVINTDSTHLHQTGIEQINTPWSDGVPGLTQDQVQPGCSYTYRWKATQHGTYFYHSHTHSMFTDGLYGPLTINPAPGTANPFNFISNDTKEIAAMEQAELDRVPILLSDWRHRLSEADWLVSRQSKVELMCMDSMLINGKGNVNCVPPQNQASLMTYAQAALLKKVGVPQLTDKSCWPPQVIAEVFTQPGAPAWNLNAIPHDYFYECSNTTGQTEVTSVTKKDDGTSGQWVWLDLIGSFGANTAEVSLDELTMNIVAADGHYVQPAAVQSVQITNGERYSVLVHLDQPKNYTLRVASVSDQQILYGSSILEYTVPGQQADTTPTTPWINERGVNTTADVAYYNMTVVQPWTPGNTSDGDSDAPIFTPDTEIASTSKFTMKIAGSAYMWAMNETVQNDTMLEEVSPPWLFDPDPAATSSFRILDVPTAPEEGGEMWADYIMVVPNGQPSHPVHIHGKHFYVLGAGSGPFPWSTVSEAVAARPGLLNLATPSLRDTYATPASAVEESWLVLRRPSNNPGVWLMHCHIQSHLQGGMSVVIQEGMFSAQRPEVPDEYLDYGCQGGS